MVWPMQNLWWKGGKKAHTCYLPLASLEAQSIEAVRVQLISTYPALWLERHRLGEGYL